MMQVASEIVNNPEDETQVSLIFANQTEKDIILKEELDEMAAKHDNFQVTGDKCIPLLFACIWQVEQTVMHTTSSSMHISQHQAQAGNMSLVDCDIPCAVMPDL